MTQEFKEEEIEDVVVGEDGVLIPESEIEKENEPTEEEINANINSMATLLKDRSNECEKDAVKLREEIAEKEAELDKLNKSLAVTTDEKIHDKIKVLETMIGSSKYLLKYVLEAGIFNMERVTVDSNSIINIVVDVLTGRKRLHSKQVNDIVMVLNGKKPSDAFDKLIERGKDTYVQKLQIFYNMRSKSNKAFIDALRLVDEKLALISTEYFKIFENLDIGRLLYIMRGIFVIYFQYMIEEHMTRGGNKFKKDERKLDDCRVAAERFFIIMQANALSAERIKFMSNIIDFIIFSKGYPHPQGMDAKDVYDANGFILSDREPLIKMQLLVEATDVNLILTKEYSDIMHKEILSREETVDKSASTSVEEELSKTADEFNDTIREQLKPGEFEEVR